MTDYAAPIRDIRFALEHIAQFEELAELRTFEEATPDLVAAILDQAGKYCAEVVAPLNRPGDVTGSRLENGAVRTPDGFPEAYQGYVNGGWNGLAFPADYGGMGLPRLLSTCVMEMLTSANMAFSLCPMLNLSGVEAMISHGSEALQKIYLPHMVTGEWPTTMQLTEPQAGSDVGALTTKAIKQEDGTYRIKGQKIYITWGEHDMADNIVHMVLARTPDAPAGTKGISMFLVPKFLVDEKGAIGERNDLRCVSLEEKLGIHASPTAVMSYGDNDDCIGYLVGEEMAGMRCMFTMMNDARVAVGLQGPAIAERAYQKALAYARERRQGSAIGKESGDKSLIIEHADVRRMLLTMKAYTEAMRSLVYYNVFAIDMGKHHPDEDTAQNYRILGDLLTPISKAWCTDRGVEVASIGIQVHGGMGYIEESGAAQYLRDARIAPIYEGTNGIQALDLVSRKIARDGGEAMKNLIETMAETAKALGQSNRYGHCAEMLSITIDGLGDATDWIADCLKANPRKAAAAASPYLEMTGYAVAGYLMAKGLLHAREKGVGDDALRKRDAMTRFYIHQLMPRANSLLGAITAGDEILYALAADEMSG